MTTVTSYIQVFESASSSTSSLEMCFGTLWRRGVTDVEILRPEFDVHGYDVVALVEINYGMGPRDGIGHWAHVGGFLFALLRQSRYVTPA